jgi:hypothetical protein
MTKLFKLKLFKIKIRHGLMGDEFVCGSEASTHKFIPKISNAKNPSDLKVDQRDIRHLPL